MKKFKVITGVVEEEIEADCMDIVDGVLCFYEQWTAQLQPGSYTVQAKTPFRVIREFDEAFEIKGGQ